MWSKLLKSAASYAYLTVTIPSRDESHTIANAMHALPLVILADVQRSALHPVPGSPSAPSELQHHVVAMRKQGKKTGDTLINHKRQKIGGGDAAPATYGSFASETSIQRSSNYVPQGYLAARHPRGTRCLLLLCRGTNDIVTV